MAEVTLHVFNLECSLSKIAVAPAMTAEDFSRTDWVDIKYSGNETWLLKFQTSCYCQ